MNHHQRTLLLICQIQQNLSQPEKTKITPHSHFRQESGRTGLWGMRSSPNVKHTKRHRKSVCATGMHISLFHRTRSSPYLLDHSLVLLWHYHSNYSFLPYFLCLFFFLFLIPSTQRIWRFPMSGSFVRSGNSSNQRCGKQL